MVSAEDLFMGELQLIKLRKEFGGLIAVNDIDIDIKAGEIRGLIGPNGSGKTTLFNLISGFLPPTGGKVIWQGKNLTGKPTHRIVKAGVTRTFQLTKLLKDMSALENVVIACYLQAGTGFIEQLFRSSANRKTEDSVKKQASELLACRN